MADRNRFAPRFMSLSGRLEQLRTRGEATVRAALGAPEQAAPKGLPDLQGEALAKHHLGIALDALSGPGISKPEGFRKLRLLVNSLEQGAPKRPRPSKRTPVIVKMPSPIHLSRRARLLNKAFESAHLVSSWRTGSPAQTSDSL
jgi:hypothetical protein